jgi:hypothetical protein
MNLLPRSTKLTYMTVDQAFDCRERPPLESIILTQFTRTRRAVEIEDRLAVRSDGMDVGWPVIGWINHDA